MTVAVIGLGFVGLTLGLALADKGVKVYGVEIKKDSFDKLSKGISTLGEKGIEQYLIRNLGKNFHVFTKLDDFIESPNTYVICVATPIINSQPNLDYLLRATKSIGKSMKGDELIIVRSTCPVGTTRKAVLSTIENELIGRGIKKSIKIVYAPERTAEGAALKELNELPQIIGGINEDSVIEAMELFRKLTPTIVQVSSLEVAEMIKLIDNSFRDVRFAYANEIMLLCEKVGIDAHECITKSNIHYSRNNIPVPSPGVGGPCLSKDPYFLADTDSLKILPTQNSLILLGRHLNESIPSILADKIRKQMEINISKQNPKIFVMGFAFKGEPETNDIRNSTTIDLVQNLMKDFEIYGHDPVVLKDTLKELGVKPVEIKEGFENSDCIIIMNNHRLYKNLDIFSLLQYSSRPCIFVDCWRLFDKNIFHNDPKIIYSGLGVV